MIHAHVFHPGTACQTVSALLFLELNPLFNVYINDSKVGNRMCVCTHMHTLSHSHTCVILFDFLPVL
jgi:hypothetical protein